MLVAAYFPGWKAPPEASVTWYQPSPWANSADGTRFMGNYPERFPAYGAVDEDQQWVIDLHLEWAESAGVDAFALCWYRDEYHTYALEKMKASKSDAPTKFALLWANNAASMDPVRSTKAYLFESIRRMAIHSLNQRCLRIDGKPVVILYSAANLDDVIRVSAGKDASYTPTQAETDALSADIKNIVGNVMAGNSTGGITGNAVAQSTDAGPYLVIQTSIERWAKAQCVDAATGYNVRAGTFGGVARLAHSFAEMTLASAQRNGEGIRIASANNKKFWPVLMAGWDSRPWGGVSGDSLADNCTPTVQEFSDACKAAIISASAPACDGIVYLYAWNELGEGGYVMPTKGIGMSRLSVLADNFK